jgi:hypothetical protein
MFFQFAGPDGTSRDFFVSNAFMPFHKFNRAGGRNAIFAIILGIFKLGPVSLNLKQGESLRLNTTNKHESHYS